MKAKPLLDTKRSVENSIFDAIWTQTDAASAEIRTEDWAKLPKDGARHHDKYLYGTENGVEPQESGKPVEHGG